jgi:hypothetical protein
VLPPSLARCKAREANGSGAAHTYQRSDAPRYLFECWLRSILRATPPKMSFLALPRLGAHEFSSSLAHLLHQLVHIGGINRYPAGQARISPFHNSQGWYWSLRVGYGQLFVLSGFGNRVSALAFSHHIRQMLPDHRVDHWPGCATEPLVC